MGSETHPVAGTLEMPVLGMHCAGCASRIEKALSRAAGVESDSVNFATTRASVQFDPDDISAAEGKIAGHPCQSIHGRAPGFQRRGEQRTAMDAEQFPQSVHTEAGSGQNFENRVRQMHVEQAHIGVAGDVSEKQVEKLWDLSAGERSGVADGDLVSALQVRVRRDGFYGSDDTVDDPGIGNQLRRQLHGLLVGNGAGEGGGLRLPARDPVDGLNALLRHAREFGLPC